MAASLILLALLLTAAIAVLVFLFAPRWRERQLERVRRGTAPASWDKWLHRGMPPYGQMSRPVRERLLGQMMVFLEEKRFEGCNGLTVTEEMRVLVAAWASLLSLGARVPYPNLRQILIYPDAFLVHKVDEADGGVVTEGPAALVGESWEQGKVVLAWSEIEAGLASGKGSNVIVHEFAHQLDALDGSMAGSPPLGDAQAHSAWAEVFTAEYEEMVRRQQSGDFAYGALDPYGATNPAEFFAVAVEAFFVTPKDLYASHDQLYGVLARYFGIDPREWQQALPSESPGE